MPIVDLPDGREIEFPDDTPKDVMSNAVKKFLSQNPTNKQSEIANESTPKEESFQEGNQRRLGEFAKGLPQGLGNKAVGFVQAATDLGESGARAIEKAIYGDNMTEPNSQSNFGGRLANQVQELRTKQATLPTSQRAGIATGEFLPTIATGIGTGAKVAAATGNKLLGLMTGSAIGAGTQAATDPYEQAGLQNRAEQTAIGTGIGAVTPAILKGAGKLISKPAGFVAEKFKPAQEQALNKVRKALTTEGKDASQALKEMEDNGLDLVDVVDPRFKAYNQAVNNLNNKDTIRIADESLKRLDTAAEKLQDEVTNMVSKNKIDPEEAGQILGRNAKKIIDAKIATRRAAAEPLYREGEKGIANLDQVAIRDLTSDEAKELGLKKGQTSLTLRDLLRSPIIRESIDIARSKSEEFSKSPGGKIYGNIYSKTKPIYATQTASEDVINNPIASRDFGTQIFNDTSPRNVNLGMAATDKGKEFTTKTQLKTPAQYEVPDHSVKVLSAVEKILNDKIGNIALTGNSSEQAALKLSKSGLQSILDNANPALKKARSLWKNDSESINELSRTSIGKIAKKYSEGKIDDLTKSAMDVLKLPPVRIMQLRKQNPQQFNDLMANSIEDKLASDVSETAGGFRKAIFGKKNGLELRAALGDDRAMYQGLEKLTNVLDRRAARTKMTANALEESTKNIKIPRGKISATWHLLDTAIEHLTNNPQVQKEFTRYMFTEEGKNALRQIATQPKQEVQERLVSDFLTRATSLGAANSMTQ